MTVLFQPPENHSCAFTRVNSKRALDLPPFLAQKLLQAEEFDFVVYQPLAASCLTIMPTAPFDLLPFYDDIRPLFFPFCKKIKMDDRQRLILGKEALDHLFPDGPDLSEILIIERDDFYEIHGAEQWNEDQTIFKKPTALENLRLFAKLMEEARALRANPSQIQSSPAGGDALGARRPG